MSSLSASDAIVANWVCAALVGSFLITRLVVCHLRRPQHVDITFAIVTASLLIYIIRTFLNHYYLKYGTAGGYTPTKPYLTTDGGVPLEIRTGTILALLARLFVSTFYWLQCAILLLFYKRVLYHLTWVRMMVRICWAIITSTYIAVALSTFLECRPFNLYWQVLPYRDTCMRAYIQLLVQCIANVVIDMALLIISSPLLTVRSRTTTQKLQVGALYIIGTFCIIINIIRTVSIFDKGSSQAVRSVWASIQAVVAAFVANAPSIYGGSVLYMRESSEASARRTAERRDTFVLIDRNMSIGGDRSMSIAKPHDPVEFKEYIAKDSFASSSTEPVVDRSTHDATFLDSTSHISIQETRSERNLLSRG